MLKYVPTAVVTAVLLGGFTMPMAQAQPVSSQALDSFIQQYGSSDGTLSLQQADKAAESHFKALDTNHDGTVDQQEIVPAGVSTAEFTAADVPDKDKKIQKEEYMTIVKKKFAAADSSGNNKLTKSELNSEAGQKLIKLLQ